EPMEELQPMTAEEIARRALQNSGGDEQAAIRALQNMHEMGLITGEVPERERRSAGYGLGANVTAGGEQPNWGKVVKPLSKKMKSEMRKAQMQETAARRKTE